jgi:hypothetical protein
LIILFININKNASKRHASFARSARGRRKTKNAPFAPPRRGGAQRKQGEAFSREERSYGGNKYNLLIKKKRIRYIKI